MDYKYNLYFLQFQTITRVNRQNICLLWLRLELNVTTICLHIRLVNKWKSFYHSIKIIGNKSNGVSPNK